MLAQSKFMFHPGKSFQQNDSGKRLKLLNKLWKKLGSGPLVRLFSQTARLSFHA